MVRQQGSRALSRLVSSKMMVPLAYYTVLALLVTTVILHLAWGQHLFAVSEGRGNSETAPLRIKVFRNTYDKPSETDDGATKFERKPQRTTKAENVTGHGLTQLDNTTKPIIVILVSSTPRSGSSFLGELLSTPRRALYLFEPFWYYSAHQRHILKHIIDVTADKLVKKELRRLMECRLSELPDMFNPKLNMQVWRKPLIMVPLSLQHRTSICNDLKLRVIKVVRPKLGSVLPLLKIPELNAHIIQLVRDPRGIVNSVSEVEGWSKHLTPSKACVMLRNDIEASLTYTDHPRLLRVRYEDLIAKPKEESRRMFSWMGLELPDEVEQFLDLHTRRTAAPPPPPTVNGTDVNATDVNATDVNGTDADSSANSSNFSTPATSEPSQSAKAGDKVMFNTSTAAPYSTPSASPNVTLSDHNLTSAEEEKPTEPPITPEEFKNYYGTIRDAKFDGLHWLKELDKTVRKEAEEVCADVLKYLNYPLVYPQEKLLE